MTVQGLLGRAWIFVSGNTKPNLDENFVYVARGVETGALCNLHRLSFCHSSRGYNSFVPEGRKQHFLMHWCPS